MTKTAEQPKPLNIYQKLVEIRKTVDVFVKDSQGYGYRYVSGTQVLKKIREKMDELGVLLVPIVLNQNHSMFNYTVYDRENKRERPKTDFVVTGDMKYVWINADDPSDRIEIPWQYMGQQDDISKAFGSALTYTERYFLMKFFSVPTDEDDPDARDTKTRQNGQLDNGKSKKASENQLKYIDALISRRITADWPKEKLYEKLKETMGVDREPSEWTVEEASKAISIITGRFE
ncbi:ERF family protein [Geobacillus subterraneus]|uniref:ERF family protein n=1 Tax=Geobacillus subterraneus TaxID=129338 RepID=UPI001613B2D9